VPIRDDRVWGLITWYVKALQNAIDMIWDNIEWRYCFPELVRRGGKLITNMGLKMHVPIIPRDRAFKKRLRDELMKDNPYAAHWVDAVIRKAYSIMENWRKRYLKGRARKVKPRIRRRFARCKTMLMKIDYQAKTIRITLKQGEYLYVSWRSTWFEHRVRDWIVGEVIIKDDRVVIPFKSSEEIYVRRVIGWDSNELSLDGHEPSIGFIHVDLKPLQSIKIVYERKKAIAQSRGKRELYEKYVRRERNREKDFINKLSAGLRMLFPNSIHVFEDLDKEDLVNRKRAKNRRKRNARTPWKRIHKRMSEVALTAYVDPSNTSRYLLLMFIDSTLCLPIFNPHLGHLKTCPSWVSTTYPHLGHSLEGKRRKKRRARMRGSPTAMNQRKL
jgi:putative transposase